MKLNQPLIISLLLHLWILTVLFLVPSAPIQSERETVEITYQPEASDLRQFVSDPEMKLQQELEKLEKKVKRLSRVTRRVQKEQVAVEKGRTQNRPPPQFSVNDLLKKEKQQSPGIDQKFNSNVARDLTLGSSSIAEHIPEVRQGGFTSLNTDQFLHYTFYARINEQIRNRWMNSIRAVVDSMARVDLQQLSRKTQITQVEVLLTPDGDFVKALLHRGADREELDDAVLTAFRLATPFLNPPAEIVQEDGYIHLHYGFYVEFRPRYVAGSK